MLKPFELKVFIYAEDEQEVKDVAKAVYDFIEENRQEGRVMTAKKLAEALSHWKDNFLVKTGIINFLNK